MLLPDSHKIQRINPFANGVRGFLLKHGEFLQPFIIDRERLVDVCLPQFYLAGHFYHHFLPKKGAEGILKDVFHIYLNPHRKEKITSFRDTDLVILACVAQVIIINIDVQVGTF